MAKTKGMSPYYSHPAITLPKTGSAAQRRVELQSVSNGGSFVIHATGGDLWVKIGDSTVDATVAGGANTYLITSNSAPILDAKSNTHVSVVTDAAADWDVYINEVG